MTSNDRRQGFWRELMQGFSIQQRLQWQAPWKDRKTC